MSGVDLAYKYLQALASDQFLNFTQEVLRQYARTVELWMVGERVILTDDPENIKAILKDQVRSERDILWLRKKTLTQLL